MEAKYQLRNITVEKEAQLINLIWADGFSHAFPFDPLRRSCPCVTCRGGHEFMGAPVDAEIFLEKPSRKREIKDLKTMGNYALQIIWEDGHNTGLYRFETLRQWAEQIGALSELRSDR